MKLTGQRWHAILPPSWKDTLVSWLHDDMPKVRFVEPAACSLMDSRSLRLARRLTGCCVSATVGYWWLRSRRGRQPG